MGVAYPFVSGSRRLRLKQRWSRQLLDILGIRLDATLGGIEPGSLIVANHISWVDIFVLNAARPVAFVAKAEVREWPLIGWLAANTDTVFLRRGSRGHAKIVNAEIDALLDAGQDVAIFPEGTTTDGTHMLGFHAALLQPAVETGRPIQPLALSYETADGKRSLAPAYAGDTTLGQCLATMLATRRIVARLRPTPPLPTPGRNRRELAQAAHAAIALKLGLPPASNRPGTVVDPPGAPPSGAAPTGSRSRVPAD
ncbi:MAG TPA: lysophospholipid acyltransferase family protein [Azospira sp.]|nr:lysophospholipid acyltransferase family protein [Azospira sp.]